MYQQTSARSTHTGQRKAGAAKAQSSQEEQGGRRAGAAEAQPRGKRVCSQPSSGRGWAQRERARAGEQPSTQRSTRPRRERRAAEESGSQKVQHLFGGFKVKANIISITNQVPTENSTDLERAESARSIAACFIVGT